MGSLPSGGQLTDSKIGHTLSLSNADGGDDDYCIKKKKSGIFSQKEGEWWARSPIPIFSTETDCELVR